MSVGKVIEVTAESEKGFQEAIEEGISRTSKSVDGIQSAWIKEMKIDVAEGRITGYRVDMKVTFLVHE
jgi:hypothetical protein